MCKKSLWIGPLLLCSGILVSCGGSRKNAETTLTDFIVQYEQTMVPLSSQINQMRWKYAETGSVSYLRTFDSLNKIKIRFLANPQAFSYLENLLDSDDIKDVYLKRQRDILYVTYLPHQASLPLQERIIHLDSWLRGQHWSRMKEKKTIEADKTLRYSNNSQDLYQAWSYLKKFAPFIKDSLLELVRLRNQLAEEVGYPDYFSLKMKLDEQRLSYVDSIFSDLERETDTVYRKMKEELDRSLMRQLVVDSAHLRPWHYRGLFFQNGRRSSDIGRDTYYGYVNMMNVATRFFAGIGLDLEDVFGRSVFSARTGQLPVFTCMTIDRKNDVRIICNMEHTENDMRMLLARGGQAAYLKNIPNTLPYLLRYPSSAVLTSGVASFFARMTGYASWVLSMGILSAGQAGGLRGEAYKSLRYEQLFACRWSLLMYNFEKRMYADPEQDLDSLWRELILHYLLLDIGDERYGMNDWASENYFSLSACHFHDFMLGELWASQITEYLFRTDTRIGQLKDPNMVGNDAVGAYFKKHVFAPGAGMTWEELTQAATGEPLSTRSFIKQFVQ